MKNPWHVLLCLAALSGVASLAQAQTVVFQYSIPVETQSKSSTALLWLPAEARQIRGLVVSGQTLMEREMSRDPFIRQACAQQGVGILFMKTGLGSVQLQKVLDDLAAKSGYSELSSAPLFLVGHSAGGPQARQSAASMPERTFGLMQYRGGGPWAGPPLTQPATTPATSPAERYVPASVPCLMMVGQFDEFGGTNRDENGREHPWQNPRDDLVAQRAAQPDSLWSMVVEPGAGHFGWSERNARYLALFIQKAAAARIPATLPSDGAAPKLLTIDPRKGWLSDMTLKPMSKIPPAPFDQFTGTKANSSWHFDEELAKASAAYHEGLDRKDQFIKWEDPYNVDAGVRFFFSKPKWVDDGTTLEVHPVYWQTVPVPPQGSGPRWLNPGTPVGNSGVPIQVKTVAGPLRAAGDHKFRIYYDALSGATEGGRITFMAYSLGNEGFRYTEQVGMLPKNFGPNPKGRDNTITFPPIGKLKVGAAPVSLKATTDSGLKVEYYVAEGPATIADGQLRITEVPVRAKFPVTIRVVAWQFGSLVEPLVKSATPVEQEVVLEKP